MSDKYTDRIAYGVEPPEGIWTDPSIFEDFILGLWDYQDEGYSEERHEFYKGEGFDLANSRDTAGSFKTSDSVLDFVKENLDISDLNHTSILDAYIDENEGILYVTLISEESDMLSLEEWELSPHEDLIFMSYEQNGAKYEVSYKIENLNLTSIED